MVHLGQAGAHLHLARVGDGGHRKARPHGVTGLELARPLGTPLPEVAHQEDPAPGGSHRHALQGHLGRLHLAPRLLLGAAQHLEIRAGRGAEGVLVEASLLQGRLLLLKKRLHLPPLDGRSQIAGHRGVDPGLLRLHLSLVHGDPLAVALRLERPVAALQLVLGLAKLEPPLFDVLDEAGGVELDHAVALADVGAVIDHPTDLKLPLAARGDDGEGADRAQLAGQEKGVLDRPAHRRGLTGRGAGTRARGAAAGDAPGPGGQERQSEAGGGSTEHHWALRVRKRRDLSRLPRPTPSP